MTTQDPRAHSHVDLVADCPFEVTPLMLQWLDLVFPDKAGSPGDTADTLREQVGQARVTRWFLGVWRYQTAPRDHTGALIEPEDLGPISDLDTL